MRRYGVLLSIVWMAGVGGVAHAAQGPVVSNVVATQIDYVVMATRPVEITYTVQDADSSVLDVTVEVSADNGATYDIIPTAGALEGDVGQISVTPGAPFNGTIYWDAVADYPDEEGSSYKVRVTADDLGFFVDLGGGVTMECAFGQQLHCWA